jgi:ubiquinone/menaquinone biosynthesis C-methylase UbiE
MVQFISASDSSQPAKKEAIRLWHNDPCGSNYATYPIGSQEFFKAVERYRYIDAPWMPSAIKFDSYAGQKLLEVGCGMGTDLIQFARGGAIVTGIDLTPRHLELTSQHFKVFGLNVTLCQSDAEKLAFDDEIFDLVYSFGVLHHTPDTIGAIREIYRVLKPGGKAIIMLYHKNSVFYWFTLYFLKGILGGKLWRQTTNDLLSQYVEYSSVGARPLVKVYSRSEAVKLVADFKQTRVDVYQLTGWEIPKIGHFIPKSVLYLLSRRWGWNLLIQATK